MIVDIANGSKNLGYLLMDENRDMTQNEALNQVQKSILLFGTMLRNLNYDKNQKLEINPWISEKRDRGFGTYIP